MARYDDDADERTRRRRYNDADERNEPRRRPSERNDVRRRPDGDDVRRRPDERDEQRSRLMERRLRARETGYDDDDEEYEEPQSYSRARISYPPSYGASSGGCASSALYVLLAVLAVVLVGVLLAPYVMSRIGGSVTDPIKQQLAQVVTPPTPTILDRGGTIQQIRSLNRLETQQFSIERVVEAKVERGNVLDTLLGDRLLLIASGNVVAGVDLSKLAASDVSISADGKSITLQLPPSQIFSAALDNNRTRVYDRQTGVLASADPNLETQARQSAETEILQAACEGEIMQKAAADGKRSMEQFLKLLNFDSVTVTVPAGTCQAPPSANTGPTDTPANVLP